VIKDGALVIEGGRVAWAGPFRELHSRWRSAREYPVGGGLITPGLTDCHTYLLGSGLTGSGGLAECLRRAWWLVGQGVTTLEVKAPLGGPGTDPLAPLRLADSLRAALPVRVLVTLLAGSAYPPGEEPEDYVLRVCDELLPAAIEAGGFDFVEVYCEEEGGISMEDASTILETVYRRKIPTRVSADRCSDSAGGALAPAFYAKSAVYLNYTDDVAVTAMGKAGTTAVLVPSLPVPDAPVGRPPVEMFREHGVPMAVATGFSPDGDPGPGDPGARGSDGGGSGARGSGAGGSGAPGGGAGVGGLADPRSAACLARVLYGLSAAEALAGITTAAAGALALGPGNGTLAVGSPADLVIWDADQPADLVSWLGAPPCREVWAAGRPLDLPGRPGGFYDCDAEESW
jgi:imidazolonepropionase